MGVPVVTLRGDRPVARQSAAMLRAIGLAELAADTPEQLADLCAGLAADRQRLSTLRQQMRSRMQASALFDAEQFAQAFLGCLRGLVPDSTGA